MKEYIIIPIEDIEERMSLIETQMKVFDSKSPYSYALVQMYTLLSELLATSKHINYDI